MPVQGKRFSIVSWNPLACRTLAGLFQGSPFWCREACKHSKQFRCQAVSHAPGTTEPQLCAVTFFRRAWSLTFAFPLGSGAPALPATDHVSWKVPEDHWRHWRGWGASKEAYGASLKIHAYPPASERSRGQQAPSPQHGRSSCLTSEGTWLRHPFHRIFYTTILLKQE